MHKLEITGATPDELYFNAIKMLSLLLQPARLAAVPAEPANPAPVPTESAAPPDGAGAEPTPGLDKAIAKGTARRGSKKTEPKILNDEIPDLAGEPKKELTLDGDIRPRLRAIQKAHEQRGNDMAACVAYLLKLYGPFGIAKAEQLKPEQFDEFMEMSEAYLKGEA